MNKYQMRELAKMMAYYQLETDKSISQGVTARWLSALIRAAMRQSQKDALIKYANYFEVMNHPEFVI